MSRRRLILAVGILGGLVAVNLFGKAAWRNWCVGKELARIRAAGEPVTADDLAAMNRVPLGTPDATAVWRAPIVALSQRALGKYPFGFTVLDTSGVVPPPDETWATLKRAEAFVRRSAELYAQIDAAVAAPGDCAYLDDFSGGYQTLLEHVQQMRMIQRLLVLRAYVRAGHEDASGAAGSLQGVWRGAETLRREPTLVTQLVRLVCNQAGVEALEHLLPSVAWDESQLAGLQKELLEIDYLPALEAAIFGERTMGIVAFDNPATAGAGNMPRAVYQLWVRDDRLSFLKHMRNLLEGVRGDWPAPLEQTAMYEAGDRNKTDVPSPWRTTPLTRPSGVVGALRGAIERAAVETGRQRAAAAGVAAVRFRKAEGRWPRSLEALVPRWMAAVPIDPCTGKPLQFRVDDEGVVIYSVGVDGKDDRGVETPEKMPSGDVYRRGEPDAVFRVRGGAERNSPHAAPRTPPNGDSPRPTSFPAPNE